MFEVIIYAVIGIGVLLAAEGIYFLIRYSAEKKRMKLRQRLRSVGSPEGARLTRERRLAKSEVMQTVLGAFPPALRLEQLLLQTDLTWTVAQILLMSFLFSFVGGMAILLILPTVKAAAVLAALAGLVTPTMIVFINRERRDAALTKQVPDALDMMARSLRAGHGIGSGFKLVATEMPPPIAVEFGRCFEEQNIGVDLREAVGHITERAPKNMELKLFAVSLVVQAETGGNLAEILEQIGTTVRERYKFFGKLKALTAEVKISAGVISATPFVFAALITFSTPDYLTPLVIEPFGRLMLLIAFALWIVGWILIRSLSQVDY